MERNNERVLAYQLATDIDLADMAAVSGGAQNTWHMTYSISGNPGGPVAFDVGFES